MAVSRGPAPLKRRLRRRKRPTALSNRSRGQFRGEKPSHLDSRALELLLTTLPLVARIAYLISPTCPQPHGQERPPSQKEERRTYHCLHYLQHGPLEGP